MRQHKNFTVLMAISMFAARHNGAIQLVFPVRGHSFMPTYWAFRRVEQIPQRRDTILVSKKCYKIFDQVGHVHKLGFDREVSYYKKIADQIVRNQLGFKLTEAIILKVAGCSL